MRLRKTLNQYKAIFFDVGDTLMTIPAAREVMYQFLANKSLYRDQEHIGKLFDDAFRLFYYEKNDEDFAECTPESDRAFWMKVYAFILEHLGAAEHASEEELHRWSHELYDVFTSPEHYTLFEDVHEVMDELKQRGYRLGVISNFALTLKHILEVKGILHFFDPVIVSTEVGLEKPNPAIFTLALQKAGLNATDVLYIGDHDKNDIWAPNQIGMDAVKLKRYAFQQGEGIRSLRELLNEG
jgi:putative hydrolase of the HAD superfamily